MVVLSRLISAVIVVLLCTVAALSSGCAPQGDAVSAPSAEAGPSAQCLMKLGLTGTITAKPVTGCLADDGEDMAFVGTSDGLYVVSGGKLVHYIYTPFGISHITLSDDITGNGWHEIVVSLGQADVASIRCHDGKTGDKLWEFAPRQRVYVESVGWTDLQLPTNDLAVAEGPEYQVLIVSSGRHLYGVDARDGREIWRFQSLHDLGRVAVLSDLNGDGVDDVAVGADSGALYLISGETGKVRWETEGSERRQTEYSAPQQTAVTSLDVYDRQAGKVIVGGGDGKVRLVDLRRRACEWVATMVGNSRDLPADVRVYAIPDVTADGLSEVLITLKAPSTDRYGSPVDSGREPNALDTYLLDGVSGATVWQRSLNTWPDWGPALAVYGGTPVLLESRTTSVVKLIALSDGSVVKQMDVTSLDGRALRACQFGDAYLAVSDGSDLVQTSAEGDTLWSYPRLSSVTAVQGDFTCDGTPDLLGLGKCSPPGGTGQSVRVLSVMDGVTFQEAWRHEVPHDVFYASGGLSSVQAGLGRSGTGRVDVIGFRSQSIFYFDGADGSLSVLEAGKDLRSLESMKAGAESGAILCGTDDEILVMDGSGGAAWRSTFASWGNVTGEVRALDDINGDEVSDMAVILPDRIIIAGSKGAGALDFEALRIISAPDGGTLAFKQLTPDLNGDGLRDLAYYERDAMTGEQTAYSALVVVSPSDGETLLRLDLDRPALFDLGCADFTGDGIPDSLVFWQEEMISTASFYQPARLAVVSGADGRSIWSSVRSDGYPGLIDSQPGDDTGGARSIPAVAVRDTEVGGYYLAVSEVSGDRVEVSLYDLRQTSLVRAISIPPLLEVTGRPEYGQYPGIGGFVETGLSRPTGAASSHRIAAIDVGDDDLAPVAVLTSESAGTVRIDTATALMDVADGRRAVYFPMDCDGYFSTGEKGHLATAAAGGIHRLNLGSDIDIVSVAGGSTYGSPVRIAWEGGIAGYSDVYVDGCRHAMTSESEVRVSLRAGHHEVFIRHIDETGKVSYAVVEIKVRQLPWSILAGIAVCVGLAAAYLYPGRSWARRVRRAQEGMDGR